MRRILLAYWNGLQVWLPGVMVAMLWVNCGVRLVEMTAADEVEPISRSIHLPTMPVLIEPDDPRPIPPLDPNGPVPVDKLQSDEWYVVESSVSLIILGSPGEVVRIEREAGPLRVRGKFCDGTGGVETRTYSSENVYFVNAVESGVIELLVIPVGVSAEQDIIRQPLTVTVGPRPPPGPGPQPEPEPEPQPEPVKSFRVIFVKESGSTLTPGQTAIPNAKAIRDFLNANTTQEDGHAGWREYDPEQIVTNEQPTMKALWEAVQPKIQTVPCWVIEVNGKATVMPYPKDTADALKLLNQYRGT